MGIQILKMRVKVKDTGRTYNQIESEMLEAIREFDGFVEIEDLDVSRTMSDDEVEEVDEMDLSGNQRRFVEDALADGLEVNYDYSGRGMYGKTCPAVSVGQYESFETSADYSTDSMGLGKVYYASS